MVVNARTPGATADASLGLGLVEDAGAANMLRRRSSCCSDTSEGGGLGCGARRGRRGSDDWGRESVHSYCSSLSPLEEARDATQEQEDSDSDSDEALEQTRKVLPTSSKKQAKEAKRMQLARKKLRKNAGIKHQLDLIWDAAKSKEEGDKIYGCRMKAYFSYHKSVCYFLMEQAGEDFDPIAAWSSAQFDWDNDSRDRAFITYDNFSKTVFEVVDMWTTSQNPKEYVAFLKLLVSEIIYEGEWTQQWPDEKLVELQASKPWLQAQ